MALISIGICMSLCVRIKNIIEHHEKNPNQFTKKIGFNSETVRKVYVGDTKDPKSSMLIAILETFPDISSHWLITGEGSMLNKNKKYGQNEQSHDMVNEDGESICYKCIGKDSQISLLNIQLEKKDDNIAELNKTVGKLQNKLDTCGCPDKGNNTATG